MVLHTSYSKLIGLEANKHIKSKVDDSIKALAGATRSSFSEDGASLAIADNLRTEVSSLNRSVQNGNSAIALATIADKAMHEQSNILDTIKQKLIQANTDTTSDEGREALGKEVHKLLVQIDNIARDTNYNQKYLLQYNHEDNNPTQEMKFLLNDLADDTVDLVSDNIQANTQGYDLADLKDSLDGGALTKDLAVEYMEKIDDALEILNDFRSEYGSTALQIQSSVRSLMTQSTNLSSAESILRDVDYGTESANFTKSSIQSRGNAYAISQANAMQANAIRALT